MTNKGDPYENALVERINGILKQAFFIDTYHQNLETMKAIIKRKHSYLQQTKPALFQLHA